MGTEITFLLWLSVTLWYHATCDDFIQHWPKYDFSEIECPAPNAHVLQNPEVLWGVERRAWLTVPTGIVVKNSTIKGAGLGTFATTFIHNHTWLGEYDGEVFSEDNADVMSAYAWVVSRAGELPYSIDGGLIERSNWLRWVNCPRTPEEENVISTYCYGKVLYRTIRPIYPGQELLVYYGDNYAFQLGIDYTKFAYHNADTEDETTNHQCGCQCKNP